MLPRKGITSALLRPTSGPSINEPYAAEFTCYDTAVAMSIFEALWRQLPIWACMLPPVIPEGLNK